MEVIVPTTALLYLKQALLEDAGEDLETRRSVKMSNRKQ